MGKSIITQEQKNQLAHLYNQGMSVAAASIQVGISKTYARRILKNRGFNIRKNYICDNISPKQRSDITKQYLCGLSMEKISVLYNVSHTTIKKILLENNVQINKSNRKYMLNESFLDAPLSDDAYYFLGLMMSDGHVSINQKKSRYVFGLSASVQDKDHVVSILNTIESTHPIYLEQSGVRKFPNGLLYKVKPKASFLISSKKITLNLCEHGIIPQKSLVAKASDQIAHNKHFWRGVLDGDGWIGYSRERPIIQLGCGSYDLAKQFHDFALERRVYYNGSVITKNQFYRVSIGATEDVVQLLKFLYDNDNVALPRKKQKALEIIKIFG